VVGGVTMWSTVIDNKISKVHSEQSDCAQKIGACVPEKLHTHTVLMKHGPWIFHLNHFILASYSDIVLTRRGCHAIILVAGYVIRPIM
jgi:hypothetical protein